MAKKQGQLNRLKENSRVRNKVKTFLKFDIKSLLYKEFILGDV
jgi:hypothetical protein